MKNLTTLLALLCLLTATLLLLAAPAAAYVPETFPAGIIVSAPAAEIIPTTPAKSMNFRNMTPPLDLVVWCP